MLTLTIDPVPIREEADGSLRVGGTRVLLELVINAFDDGATPESMIQRYPTLTLADTYSVISYYLRHRDEVADYLARRQEKAREVARKIESAGRDLSDIRRRLLSARTPSATDHAATGG